MVGSVSIVPRLSPRLGDVNIAGATRGSPERAHGSRRSGVTEAPTRRGSAPALTPSSAPSRGAIAAAAAAATGPIAPPRTPSPACERPREVRCRLGCDGIPVALRPIEAAAAGALGVGTADPVRGVRTAGTDWRLKELVSDGEHERSVLLCDTPAPDRQRAWEDASEPLAAASPTPTPTVPPADASAAGAVVLAPDAAATAMSFAGTSNWGGTGVSSGAAWLGLLSHTLSRDWRSNQAATSGVSTCRCAASARSCSAVGVVVMMRAPRRAATSSARRECLAVRFRRKDISPRRQRVDRRCFIQSLICFTDRLRRDETASSSSCDGYGFFSNVSARVFTRNK